MIWGTLIAHFTFLSPLAVAAFFLFFNYFTKDSEWVVVYRVSEPDEISKLDYVALEHICDGVPIVADM